MALVLPLGWEEMFVREESGFWWGFRCLVDEEKEKHWERKVNEGKVFLCFFKCCIIFQVLLSTTDTVEVEHSWDFSYGSALPQLSLLLPSTVFPLPNSHLKPISIAALRCNFANCCNSMLALHHFTFFLKTSPFTHQVAV